MTHWPLRVIALATSGEKRRQAEAPSTPKREFMRILRAWASSASPAVRALARAVQSRATRWGRIPGGARRKAAPLGVRSTASVAAGSTRVRGSMLNVRIRLG
jgi:hypothetical protein